MQCTCSHTVTVHTVILLQYMQCTCRTVTVHAMHMSYCYSTCNVHVILLQYIHAVILLQYMQYIYMQSYCYSTCNAHVILLQYIQCTCSHTVTGHAIYMQCTCSHTVTGHAMYMSVHDIIRTIISVHTTVYYI